jgi:hypothetical protein
MKTKKKFDCIRMKDEAQQRRAEQLRGLSPQERLDYYKREYQSLTERQGQLRRLPGS